MFNLIERKNIIVAILLLILSKFANATENYSAILANADKARGYYDGLTLNVSIKNKKKYHRYHVMISGYDVLAITLSPEKNKGNKVLMSAGMMWFHKVGLRNATAVPRARRLLGDGSYGDILSTNYAQNYSIESVNNEILNNRPCWLFELKSKTKKNTYDKVYYWVDKEHKTAMKSDFFSISGKKLKSAKMEYQQSIVVNSIKKPLISKATIIDKIKNESITTIEFSKPILKVIPQRYFNFKSFHKEQYPIN